jgi:hypothetical protein
MRKLRLIDITLGVALAAALIALFHFVDGSREAVGTLLRRLPYLLLLLWVPLALYFLPRYRKSHALTDEGLRLLEQGRIVAALEKFEASRPLAKSKVIPTYNIGISRLQLWQLRAAERELSSLEAREDLTPQFRAILYAALALVAAMDGRLKQAVERLDEAKTLHAGPFQLGALAAAVVSCRTGRWAEAREHLQEPGLEKLTGPLRSLREALWAWCQERHGGGQCFVDVISVFGEASPDSLEAAWPEFVAFLLERSRRAG